MNNGSLYLQNTEICRRKEALGFKMKNHDYNVTVNDKIDSQGMTSTVYVYTWTIITKNYSI
jgi:hypothetical protein